MHDASCSHACYSKRMAYYLSYVPRLLQHAIFVHADGNAADIR